MPGYKDGLSSKPMLLKLISMNTGSIRIEIAEIGALRIIDDPSYGEHVFCTAKRCG
jgi:hypothetical protein